MVEKLYELLKDKDSQVIINAVTALHEILHKEGGLVLTRNNVIYLINKITGNSPIWG
jgi:vesicle coat complex subunit